MDETVKIALFLSSLVNLLLLGLGSFFVSRRGGLPYLFQKVYFLLRTEAKIKLMDEIPYYRDKTSHFRTLPNTNSEIIFLGDSLTDYCEWAEFFRDKRIKNRGISGDTTYGILNRLDEIVDSKPQKLFLMVGINDLNQGREISNILNDYRLILEKLKAQVPNTEVFIQSVLPINNRESQNKLGLRLNNDKVIELNAKLKDLAKGFSFNYIDLFTSLSDGTNELDACYTSDGVHLNGQAYLIWKEIIERDVVS